MSSIERLPVEILHCIFDHLDTQTIIYSIRLLSRLFHSVVITYNRHVLNFNLISKSNFYLYCQLIHPQNIMSLTLSNDEPTLRQIDLFILLGDLRQFTRLRSLTLLQINKDQLNFILQRINLQTLISLSIYINYNPDRSKQLITNLFSSFTIQTNLRKLEFDTSIRRTKMWWALNDIMEYLFTNNRMNIDDLYKILQCSPHLHTLILTDIPRGTINKFNFICFRQLTSLTIKHVGVTIDELELFLEFTSSLVYLKLIGGMNMFNGKRWEEFIQINLPQLDKLEFYFSGSKSSTQTLRDLKLTLDLFKTPFWIEHKKWFIACEYENYPSQVKIVSLYSIPICTSHIHYISKSGITSLFTSTTMINNDIPTKNNIKSLTLTLNESTANEIQEKCTMTHCPLFPAATEIDLQFYTNWPLISLQSLSIFIDISRIVSMKISCNYLNENIPDLLMKIKSFLKQAYNLVSLSIHSSFYKNKSDRTIEHIHSILPHHIKHLQIPIDDLNQINRILKRCENLTIIELDINNQELFNKIINWFAHHTIYTTCQKSNGIIAVWLGKKIIQPTEIYPHYKRIKFQ